MELVKMQIDGKEFATSTIIDYSSLIQLLTIVVKKCNSFDTKLNYLDSEMKDKERRLSNVEISLNINNDQPNYFPVSPIIKHKENYSMEILDISGQLKETEKENEKENESEKEKVKDSTPEKNKEKIELNYTMFSELYKRVKDHEKSIKNIIKTININQKNAQEKHEEIQKNTDAINSTLNDEIKKLNSFIEKVDNKIMVYDEDLDNLKDKLKDFNIYDMFKYQNLSSEID